MMDQVIEEYDFVVCLFIGVARSGHTIVSSVIDNHPNAWISNEYAGDSDDMIDAMKRGVPGDELLDRFMRRADVQRKTTRYWTKRERGEIDICPIEKDVPLLIGDKRVYRLTERLASEQLTVLDLEEYFEAPVRLVRVVRDPFDNVLSIFKHMKRHVHIGQSVNYFRKMSAQIRHVREMYSEHIIEIDLESFCSHLRPNLHRLYKFLGLPWDQAHYENCRKHVFKTVRQHDIRELGIYDPKA